MYVFIWPDVTANARMMVVATLWELVTGRACSQTGVCGSISRAFEDSQYTACFGRMLILMWYIISLDLRLHGKRVCCTECLLASKLGVYLLLYLSNQVLPSHPPKKAEYSCTHSDNPRTSAYPYLDPAWSRTSSSQYLVVSMSRENVQSTTCWPRCPYEISNKHHLESSLWP